MCFLFFFSLFLVIYFLIRFYQRIEYKDKQSELFFLRLKEILLYITAITAQQAHPDLN